MRHLTFALLLATACATGGTRPSETGARLAIQAFVDSGDFRAARAQLARAVSEAAAVNDTRELGAALTWSGFAHYAELMTSGKTTGYEEPRDSIAKALTLRQQSGDQRAIAETLFYLGILEEKLGNEARALELYQQSLDIAVSHKFLLEESYAQRHIAFVEGRRGQLQSALARQQRSLALREQIGFREYIPFSLIAVANLHEQMGAANEALAHYLRAAQLAEKSGARRTRVLVALSLGDAYQTRGRAAEARQQYELALRLASEIGNQRDIAAARSRLDGR